MLGIAIVLLQAAAPLPVAALPTGSHAKPKQICRSISGTGSRLGGRRVCATAQEWEQRAREDKATIDTMQANTVPNIG